MKLYGAPASPYVRKARVLIHEKKLKASGGRKTVARGQPSTTRNTLGKGPALEIDPTILLIGPHVHTSTRGREVDDPKDAAGSRRSGAALEQGSSMRRSRASGNGRPPRNRSLKKSRAKSAIHAPRGSEGRFRGGPFLVGKACSLADS